MNNIVGNDRHNRNKKTAKAYLSDEVYNSLSEIIDEFQHNPKGMEYFYQKSKSFLDETNFDFKDKKVIGTMCVHIPEELIYALGATPLRLCRGSYAMDQVGAEFLPAKSCPLIKSTLGGIHLDNYPMGTKPLLIISDCNLRRKDQK